MKKPIQRLFLNLSGAEKEVNLLKSSGEKHRAGTFGKNCEKMLFTERGNVNDSTSWWIIGGQPKLASWQCYVRDTYRIYCIQFVPRWIWEEIKRRKPSIANDGLMRRRIENSALKDS